MKRLEIYCIHNCFALYNYYLKQICKVFVSFATCIFNRCSSDRKSEYTLRIIGNIVVIKVRGRNYNCMNIRLSTIEPR